MSSDRRRFVEDLLHEALDDYAEEGSSFARQRAAEWASVLLALDSRPPVEAHNTLNVADSV